MQIRRTSISWFNTYCSNIVYSFAWSLSRVGYCHPLALYILSLIASSSYYWTHWVQLYQLAYMQSPSDIYLGMWIHEIDAGALYCTSFIRPTCCIPSIVHYNDRDAVAIWYLGMWIHDQYTINSLCFISIRQELQDSSQAFSNFLICWNVQFGRILSIQN